MTSLNTPGIAKVAGKGKTATDVFVRLRRHGYLSIRALLQRDAVIALIQETEENYRVISSLL